METVNSMRIAKSLHLLHETNLPISDIVNQVGFSTYTQMIYEFKKQVGYSPTKCRKIFLNDEMEHCNQLYNSVAIRVDEEDFLLDDDAYFNRYYKKNIQPKSQNLFKKI